MTRFIFRRNVHFWKDYTRHVYKVVENESLKKTVENLERKVILKTALAYHVKSYI